MSIIDEWAERHILKALEKGQLDNLPGAGKPLEIEDDSFVPVHLRAGYRILKNAGFLPPEIEQRRQALELVDLLETIEEDTPEFTIKARALQTLELKMKLAGIDTAFLQSHYKMAINKAFNK